MQHLIKTNGVGPTLAMAVLATHPPAALVDIIASNDVAALTLVSGVGKKTAERLLVELRDRLSLPMLDTPAEFEWLLQNWAGRKIFVDLLAHVAPALQVHQQHSLAFRQGRAGCGGALPSR